MNTGINGSAETAQAISGINIDIVADATVSYATYQNNVPLLRSLSLTNLSDQPLHEVEITVRCEPHFADAVRLKFERIDSQETRRIESLDLKFQHRYLADLNEAERGRILVQVSSSGTEVARADHSVDVLAYD